MNKVITFTKRVEILLNPTAIAKLLLASIFLAFTIFNINISLSEPVMHTDLLFIDSFLDRFTAEGRWITFSLFEVQRYLPQWLALPLCYFFIFIFGYQVAQPLIKDRWLAFCFALTIVSVPNFSILLKWPITLAPGLGLLALFSLIKGRLPITTMMIMSGIVLFATYPTFYFLVPLIYIDRYKDESYGNIIKFLLLWVAGYILGYSLAQLSVFFYTFFTQDQAQFIELASWRYSNPTRNLSSLLDNILDSILDFKTNALFISQLSPLFFVPVTLVFLWSLNRHLKYNLIVISVIFSIYASVIVLGVHVPIRTGFTFSIGIVMIVILTQSTWGKAFLLVTLFIPFSYSAYNYHYFYNAKRAMLRDIIESSDPNGLTKQPDRFQQVIVETDKEKINQYLLKVIDSNQIKVLNKASLNRLVKPYFYLNGWEKNKLKFINTPSEAIIGETEIEDKGNTLYIKMK